MIGRIFRRTGPLVFGKLSEAVHDNRRPEAAWGIEAPAENAGKGPDEGRRRR